MLISFNDMVFDFSIGKYRNIQKSDYIMTTTGYNAPIEKNDKIELYSIDKVGHSMKRKYKSIYIQMYPIIIDFLKSNNCDW